MSLFSAGTRLRCAACWPPPTPTPCMCWQLLLIGLLHTTATLQTSATTARRVCLMYHKRSSGITKKRGFGSVVASLHTGRLHAECSTCTSVNQRNHHQVASTNSLRSSAITLQYFQNQCNLAFGRNMTQDTDAFNAKYGGFRPNTTRVIALNGRCCLFVWWSISLPLLFLSSQPSFFAATIPGAERA